MRILHLGKYYAPQRGGIERHLQDLCEWFAGHGHQVAALVHQAAGCWRSSMETIHEVEICRVACVAAPLYAPISPTFPLQLARLIKRVKPQVLHLHLPNPSCFWALLSRRARALPWVVHWHADVSAEMPDWRVRAAYRLYRPFEQAVLARASAIVVTSQAYLDASGALARWRDKCTVVPLGIAEANGDKGTAPIWPRPDLLRLLAVGRLSHYKGFAVLLDALARTPVASLVLIGQGEESDRLRAQVARLGLGDRVALAGELSEADLLAAYAAADALVLPSLDRSEAFGLVLLEAMRARLALVASNIAGSGIGQVIVNEISGLLVKPGDEGELATALSRISDPLLRAALADAGHQRWREHFTLEQSAQSVLAIYRQLAAAGRQAARQSG